MNHHILNGILAKVPAYCSHQLYYHLILPSTSIQAGGIDARAGGLGVRQLGIVAAHSQLDPRVVESLKILYSQEVYRFALLEMGIDAPDLPTGNLTEYHLQLCMFVLVANIFFNLIVHGLYMYWHIQCATIWSVTN